MLHPICQCRCHILPVSTAVTSFPLLLLEPYSLLLLLVLCFCCYCCVSDYLLVLSLPQPFFDTPYLIPQLSHLNCYPFCYILSFDTTVTFFPSPLPEYNPCYHWLHNIYVIIVVTSYLSILLPHPLCCILSTTSARTYSLSLLLATSCFCLAALELSAVLATFLLCYSPLTVSFVYVLVVTVLLLST